MTKRSHFQVFNLFSFEMDSRYKKKNNQVSRIHNPISPFTVPTCIKLRPLSKLYVTVQQDFLMTIYKKKNILYMVDDNNNNSNSHNSNDNIIYNNNNKDINIKKENTLLHLLLYSDRSVSHAS